MDNIGTILTLGFENEMFILEDGLGSLKLRFKARKITRVFLREEKKWRKTENAARQHRGPLAELV